MRLIGSVVSAMAALTWLWLVIDPLAANRVNLSAFGFLYAAIGIGANLSASISFARLRSEMDGLAWGITVAAITATITLFSDESPIGSPSPLAATALLVLIALQGASLLLLQRYGDDGGGPTFV